ncbi:hypothetical protein E3U36_05830 [Arsenophonus endosymbiont of Aphis craccivora]|uniref:pentapeptide repeat-containing protein n=1 Tax=Arsenophonus endosymbiont of Aphis craccivora TaxID=1231049 RepID=UPI0015DCC5D8|nr:pentapeptide repeat-containing protein [Arsenophonus endosymbiont of Aphis craccivora]QLK87769.1 hypothetical protein E3U36_05830 [Arsenophonus endosymbiont of Aphis craccivora]
MNLLFKTLTIVSLLGLSSLSLADKNNETISGDTNYPDLTAANLGRTNLIKANLTATNLATTDLTKVDLTAANLGVTHLTETDLSTEILTEIENGKILAEAGFDAN